ncbi:YhgE/Pip domain-containing protein [Paenibacillus rhizovicinus]|uniref:YhgE/Pip domain-containing protein n=1 Tax=Paenibacillus rhizovicinus TaxID=2704463 RepID=A0A6C0NYU6_9BACL|nr:YhgE/Pip domain-containing protein [Paenibacillus rhizovicinus]QHW30873.1 YhgE/Pip domain-containing protein [Paenibacillus rhizovicinus]
MQGLSLFGKELSRIVRNPKLLIPILGILFIPIMYSGMLIGAFWDPYGKLDKMPVAVVNADAGADFKGKPLSVGADLVKELKANPSFKWTFVDAKQAEDGLKNGNYYYVIEIPSEFSQQATTLLDKEPHPAALKYLTNDSENFLAAKIGASAIEKLQTDISQQVTKAYAEAVFGSIGEAADGFTQASEGAGKLADGAKDAEQGAAQLRDNIAKLASSTKQLVGGVDALGSGAGQLKAGTAAVSDGSAKLSAGLGKLAAAGERLGDGADSAVSAGAKLADGLASAQQSSADLAGAAAKLSAALDAYAAAQEGAAREDSALQGLIGAARELSAGAAGLSGGSAKLAAGGAQLQQGQRSLQQGLDALHAQLAAAAQSGAELSAGAKTAAAGAAKLADGAAAAGRGAAQLSGGADKLASGSAALASGASQLAGGSAELSGKLGYAASQTEGVIGTDALYDMFANPVHVEERKLTNVPNYGTGFAPYALSLGLFVGALLSTMVVPMRETGTKPRSAWSWFVSKALLFAGVGVIQALIADAILLYGIGMHANHMGAFVGMSVLTSIAFMMIIQFLVTLLDQPGRFVSVILLILQLTGSAGTYPPELVPAWLQRIGVWLPMTYAIRSFREILTGNELQTTGGNAAFLAVVAILFAALSLIVFVMMRRKEQRQTAVPSELAL